MPHPQLVPEVTLHVDCCLAIEVNNHYSILGPQINDYIKVKALYICNNYCNSADIAEIIVQWEEMVS